MQQNYIKGKFGEKVMDATAERLGVFFLGVKGMLRRAGFGSQQKGRGCGSATPDLRTLRFAYK